MGKTHALYRGYQVAKGDWLLFTDADTTHTPGLLAGVMALWCGKAVLCVPGTACRAGLPRSCVYVMSGIGRLMESLCTADSVYVPARPYRLLGTTPSVGY